MNTPTPALLAKLSAHLNPGQAADQVTPATTHRVLHDGVVKTKHLRPGQRVRPCIYGVPRSSERTVESVTRLGDGSWCHVTFSSPHPAADFKAAYRWHDASLAGQTIEIVEIGDQR